MYTRKKIAFVFEHMIIGGAERVLVEFLKRIDYERFDLTVYTAEESNISHFYFDQVPHLEVRYILAEIKTKINEEKKRKPVKYYWHRVQERIDSRREKSYWKRYENHLVRYPISDEVYDCVIAYKFSLEDTVFALFGLQGKQKFLWIHQGIDSEFGEHYPEYYRLNEKFDRILCVSEAVRSSLKKYSDYAYERSEVFYNLFNEKMIREKAHSDSDILPKNTIVTVGRLINVKGQNLIPETLYILLQNGIEKKWYIVGDGPLRPVIEAEIKKYHLEDWVKLIGTVDNPYPYIQQCELYVQPSYQEGFCTATYEAAILKKPVITTYCQSMFEQFKNGENAIICEGNTAKDLANGIMRYYHDDKLRTFIQQNIGSRQDESEVQLNRFYSYFTSEGNR